MEAQVEKFKDFIEKNYLSILNDNLRKDKRFLVIDFAELSMFNPELAEILLEQPEDTVRTAELAIEQLDLDNAKNVRVRFKNLPQSQFIQIRNIRSAHLNKLYQMEGIVRQKSDVRPQVTAAKFECPSCGNIINVLQLDTAFKEPTRCGCGRKGKFNMISKELVDAQGLVLEESPESLDGGDQPKRMNVFLKDDLVSPFSERKTSPGAKIRVVGMIKEVPIILRTGTKSTRFDLLIEANCVEAVEETFYEVGISEEEERQIKELSEDPKLIDKLIASIAPSIYGHDRIKEAILLQMMGGVHKKRKDGVQSRGDMHVLLIGDPGAGKSALLKRANIIAPKARYVSGKGVSGAGLTAAVVKDEFLKGWSLEAGAMVLASNGLVCIDEMDKIGNDDRAAMHEAMENQSYHPGTKIMLSDGTVHPIGDFVDKIIESNKSKVIPGKDCEMLPVNDIELLTTDFNKIFPVKAKMVSRHLPPEYFIKVTYSNGRSIAVTPEHPIFIYADGGIREIPAENVRGGMLAPSPRNLPTRSKESSLDKGEAERHFQHLLDKDLARLLGYIITEGHSYNNPSNRYAEIGVSNTNENVITEASELFSRVSGAHVNLNIRYAENTCHATKDLTTARVSSKPFYSFMLNNFRGSINKARGKYVDNVIRCSKKENQLAFLSTAFKGDGFVDSTRCGFITSSEELAQGYQDLLLQNGIWSRIDTECRLDKKYYKVAITGTQSFKKFNELIVEPDDKRKQRLRDFYSFSKRKRNERDILPRDMLIEINNMLKDFGASDGNLLTNIVRGYNAHKETVFDYVDIIKERILSGERIIHEKDTKKIRKAIHIPVALLAKELKVSSSTIYNIEKNSGSKQYFKLLSAARGMSARKIKNAKSKIGNIEQWRNSDIRCLKINKVEKVRDDSIRWVYDVTVEPTRTFISEGLVLHNTVSISKANIQATLISRTTVLAAANPKFGRFDPYGIVAEQIDLPPTLINRFDLIFTIKDLPDEKKDSMLASHILNLHQSPQYDDQEINTDLLKKYIGYAKRNIQPKLSDGAIEEIKKYYLKMRSSGGGEDGVKTIPISARQLEGLVRMSEANARIRLCEEVTRKDAKRAIAILEYSLMDVGFDKETGKIDIDRIATGVSASARNNISVVKEAINELEGKIGKTIPIDDVVALCKEKGVSEEKVEEVLEKLKRTGDVFEPRHGFLSKI